MFKRFVSLVLLVVGATACADSVVGPSLSTTNDAEVEQCVMVLTVNWYSMGVLIQTDNICIPPK